MPENKRCRNCNALTHDCIPEAGKRCCGAWRPRQPEPEKRIFEGILDENAQPSSCWPGFIDYLATTKGKKTRITVEVLK